MSFHETSPTPRKVVFIESAGAMGGVQFSTLYLARQLNREPWKPIVVCPEEGDLTRRCREAGVETHVVQQPRSWSTGIQIGTSLRIPNPLAWARNAGTLVFSARRLRNFLKRLDADVIVTKGFSAHLFGGLAARSLGIPCVWHAQDLISERNLGLNRMIFSWAARRLSTRVIADGVAIKNQLSPKLHSRTAVVLNGVNTNEFSPTVDATGVREEFGIPHDHLIVGQVGRLTPWKGQHHLIEAFAQIAAEHSRTTLLLVGSPVFDNDSYERRLVSMANRFGLMDRIKFAGYRHDMARLMAAMDIFAFTSTEKDTSPLVLLSAMASGLPIVAFDIEGVREVMATENQFRLAPVADTARLAQELRIVISSETLRQELGTLARRQATSEFGLERYTARIESVIRAALAEAGETRQGNMETENTLKSALPDAQATAPYSNLN